MLLVIADHAGDDGTEAWPSQATIATKASMSIRTVQRSVNTLVEKGYLWVAKHQGGSANCRDDRRPHKYTINMSMLRGDNATGRRRDADGATFTPDTGRLSRPKNLTKEPPLKQTDEFNLFWSKYPLKVGKQAALKAFVGCVRAGADPQDLIVGAEKYANDPNRHPSYTAHASTWLNAGRWLDEALPPREKTDEEIKAELEHTKRLKLEQQKADQEAWRKELAEREATSTPMPEYLKEMFRRM